MDQRDFPIGLELARREPAHLDQPYAGPGVGSFAAGPPANVSLADYWRILLKRKWIVVMTAIVVFTLAVLYTLHIDAHLRGRRPDQYWPRELGISADEGGNAGAGR